MCLVVLTQTLSVEGHSYMEVWMVIEYLPVPCSWQTKGPPPPPSQRTLSLFTSSDKSAQIQESSSFQLGATERVALIDSSHWVRLVIRLSVTCFMMFCPSESSDFELTPQPIEEQMNSLKGVSVFGRQIGLMFGARLNSSRTWIMARSFVGPESESL